MQASFHVDGLPEPHYGEVGRINLVAVSGTRSCTFYIRVMNPAYTLKIGQFTKGDIVLRRISDQIVLPLLAIRDPDAQPWVPVVLNGRVERRPVKVLLRSESNQLAAVSGVNAGEQVIAVNLLDVNPGDVVCLSTGQLSAEGCSHLADSDQCPESLFHRCADDGTGTAGFISLSPVGAGRNARHSLPYRSGIYGLSRCIP